MAGFSERWPSRPGGSTDSSVQLPYPGQSLKQLYSGRAAFSFDPRMPHKLLVPRLEGCATQAIRVCHPKERP